MRFKRLRRILLTAFTIALLIVIIWQKVEFYTTKCIKPERYIIYTMQPYECVDGIALRYKPGYMRLDEYRSKIQVLNNTAEMIQPGTKIKLPIYDDK